METEKECLFDKLSNKIIFEIFTHLDYNAFLNASQVCLRWNKIIEEHIDFFSSFFEDVGEEEGEETEETDQGKKRKLEEVENQVDAFEEQKIIVEQINSTNPSQYHELLGVSTEAEENEIRNQYKKLALLVHPDKNKHPGASRAFQTLKRAFDAIMSGVDPMNPDTCKIDCPDTNCGATVYLAKDRYQNIIKGLDVGTCRACKQKFGRVFCTHCFAAWTMALNPDFAGQLAMCSVCHKQFAIQYPKPAPKPVAPSKAPTVKKPVVKKQKKELVGSPQVKRCIPYELV